MPTKFTFNDVAKNIIKETISSAIFIDDHALENFKTKNSKYKKENDRTINLFNDFKENQCLIHPFKFTKKGWKKDKKFYLKNKDLLILDWQLVKEDHSEALNILDEAVSEKSLHFICIYTQENQDAVKNEINKYFLGKLSESEKEDIRKFLNGTDLDDYWLLEKNHSDWEKLDTSINNIINAKPKDTTSQIKEFIEFYDLEEKIIEFIKTIEPTCLITSFAKLRTALSSDELSHSKHSNLGFFKKSSDDDITFYIGHTIIKIFEKDLVSGTELYNSFLSSFLGEKNIFLSLMGLEMRNRFRENSAFIGKDFDDLSEIAFFYHKNKNGEHPEIFFDFLREILKDQVAAFIYEKNLTLFDEKILLEYFKSISGGRKLADFEGPANSDNFINEIFKLNYFYNRVDSSQRSLKKLLKFGDVFTAQINIEQRDGTFKEEKRYFMCLTPLCDCLRPKDKIRNQFWFIEGKKEESEKSILKGTDGKFLSFIKVQNKIIGVDWKNGKGNCQPFTMLVIDNNFSEKLTANYFGDDKEFEFLDSIKENYTQRIANEAFGYPIRVGIDFVKK
tara:strand:+ start:4675 stop:6357 length:1683 start_codon:yes stop_codon:yes gene_type:complete